MIARVLLELAEEWELRASDTDLHTVLVSADHLAAALRRIAAAVDAECATGIRAERSERPNAGTV